MIITLIVAVVLIVGIVLLTVDFYTSVYCSEAAVFTTVIGAFAAVVVGVCIIANFATLEVNYENKIYEKEMLEYRIEHYEPSAVGNELLYNDVVEFNNNLRIIKKWAANPWTNWFCNHKIATIEYINLELLELKETVDGR